MNLVFCFASTGEKEYLELIKSIVAIGKERGKVLKVLSCKTSEEVCEEVTRNG